MTDSNARVKKMLEEIEEAKKNKNNTIYIVHPAVYEREKQARRENEKPWKFHGIVVEETDNE